MVKAKFLSRYLFLLANFLLPTRLMTPVAQWLLDEEVPCLITGRFNMRNYFLYIVLVWVFWVERRSEFRCPSSRLGNSVVVFHIIIMIKLLL